MRRSLKHSLRLTAVLLMFGALVGAANAETARSMLDGDVFAVEANYVELVVNASGEVIQVRVEGCEPCMQSSYLPSRELSISRQGKVLEVPGAIGLSGSPATLVVRVGSKLVEKVDFWVPRGKEGGEQ